MGRQLTDEESGIYRELRGQIQAHHRRNEVRSVYRNAKAIAQAKGVPPGLHVPLDWPSLAVSVMASKLLPEFYSFRAETSLRDDLEQAWADANIDIVELMAIEAAVSYGPSFVFTGVGDPAEDEPPVVVTVAPALTATAKADPRTRRTVAALHDLDQHTSLLYLPGRTLKLSTAPGVTRQVVDEWGSTRRVLCSVFSHDVSTDHPMGRSRITDPVVRLTDSAMRTLMRQELSAEYYQSPRPLFFGMSAEDLLDDRGVPVLERAIGTGWAFPDLNQQESREPDYQLRRSKVEWAPQMSMQPFSDQFRLIAGAFCGATKVPQQHLGVMADSNPTSAEAIRAQETPLVQDALVQQKWMNLGRRSLAVDVLTALYGDLDEGAVKDLRGMVPRWNDPRHQSITEQSQFAAAQVSAGNLQAGTETTLRQLPMSEEDVQAALAENKAAAAAESGAALLARALEEASRAGEQPEPAGVTIGEIDADPALVEG